MISVIMTGCFSVDSIRSTPAAVTTPTTPPPAPVEIVQHPKIELAVDAQPFIELGCVRERHRRLDCTEPGLETQFSCDYIEAAPAVFGGLTPSVPLAQCWFEPQQWPNREGIEEVGCAYVMRNELIVLVEGQLQLLKTQAEFRQFFGPVNSPEEGVSFVAAFTDAYPRFNLSVPGHYELFVDEIETTYVKAIGDGFEAHLFNNQRCSCGPHPEFVEDYRVTRAGEIEQIFRQKIYQDPDDLVCVD